MNADDVRTLLDYHYWARDRVLDAVEPLSPEQLTGAMGGSFDPFATRSFTSTGLSGCGIGVGKASQKRFDSIK